MRKLLAAATIPLLALALTAGRASASGAALSLGVSCTAAGQPIATGSVTNTGPDGTVQGVWGIISDVKGLKVGDKVAAGAVIKIPAHVLVPGRYNTGVQLVYPGIGTRASDPLVLVVTADTCHVTASTEPSTAPTVPPVSSTVGSTVAPATTTPHVVTGPPATPDVPPATTTVTSTVEGITETSVARTTTTDAGKASLPATGAAWVLWLVRIGVGLLGAWVLTRLVLWLTRSQDRVS